jgi:hypothetical protein
VTRWRDRAATGRSGAPLTFTDRVVFVVLAAAAAVIMALDVVTVARLLAFAWSPPAAHEVQGRVSHEALGRRRGSLLRVETPDGWIALSTGPSTVLGSRRSAVDSKFVYRNIATKVAWIDAPARATVWTTHYPVRVEQLGHVLLDIDGAAGIARAELPGVIVEALLAGVVASALLWTLLAASRREERELAAAWHRHRER